MVNGEIIMNKIYNISESETNEICELNSKKCAYIELISRLPQDSTLYPEVMKEFTEINTSYRKWFSTFEMKYLGHHPSNGAWHVDFQNRSVAYIEEGKND